MNGHLATVGRDVGRILRVLSGIMFDSVVVAAVWGNSTRFPHS